MKSLHLTLLLVAVVVLCFSFAVTPACASASNVVDTDDEIEKLASASVLPRMAAKTANTPSAWKRRLVEERDRIPAYPGAEKKWQGRGIVTSAGGRSYFTSAFVMLHVLRQHVKCTLPIEVMYAGSDELPPAAIAHIESALPNVKFVDLTKVPELKGLSLKGYQVCMFVHVCVCMCVCVCVCVCLCVFLVACVCL